MSAVRGYGTRRAGPPGRRPLLAGTFVVLLLALLVSKLLGGGAATADDGAAPQRIAIPSIGVKSSVIPLGLQRDGTLDTPKDYGRAGWYTGGPEPGEPGPAVIIGHVDSKSGPAVFFALPRLHSGDHIRIARADGSTVRFKVDRIEQWPKNSFPTDRVYGATERPELRLITCSGDFDRSTGHYTANTIVYASRD